MYTRICHVRWGMCVKIKTFMDRFRVQKLMDQYLLKLAFSGDEQRYFLVEMCIFVSSVIQRCHILFLYTFSFLAAGSALPREQAFWILLFSFFVICKNGHTDTPPKLEIIYVFQLNKSSAFFFFFFFSGF